MMATHRSPGAPPRITEPVALATRVSGPPLLMCEFYAAQLRACPWGEARVTVSGPDFDRMLAEIDALLGLPPPRPARPAPRTRSPLRSRVPLAPPAAQRGAG